MKNLVTITGAPATKGMVVRELAWHLGKATVVAVASRVVTRIVLKSYFDSKTRIDWNHPAFRI